MIGSAERARAGGDLVGLLLRGLLGVLQGLLGLGSIGLGAVLDLLGGVVHRLLGGGVGLLDPCLGLAALGADALLVGLGRVLPREHAAGDGERDAAGDGDLLLVVLGDLGQRRVRGAGHGLGGVAGLADDGLAAVDDGREGVSDWVFGFGFFRLKE